MFGNGSMFTDEQLYDGKVFLRSYADSLRCIKQAAEASEVSSRNEIMMNKIIKTKEQDKSGAALKSMKEYKLLQFTNFIFKKYLPEFDSFQGEYPEFKDIIENGLKKMLDEINPQNQSQ